MRGHKLGIGFVLSLMIPPWACPQITPTQVIQTDDAILEHTVRGFDIASGSAPEVFRELALDASIPAGVVKARQAGHETRFRFAMPSGTTIRDALNYIVSIDRRYSWSLSKGVLNLTPAKDKFPLLEVSVTRFDSGDATTVSDACTRVFQLAEVQTTVRSLGIEEDFIELGPTLFAKDRSAPQQPPKKISVQLVNTPVRGILNAIVSSAGKALWTYEEYDSQGRHFYKIGFTE
jgi:hypothetical protein